MKVLLWCIYCRDELPYHNKDKTPHGSKYFLALLLHFPSRTSASNLVSLTNQCKPFKIIFFIHKMAHRITLHPSALHFLLLCSNEKFLLHALSAKACACRSDLERPCNLIYATNRDEARLTSFCRVLPI